MRKSIDRILEWSLALLLAIMVLDVSWGVFTRYALGNQSSWTDELARFLLIWVSILGAAYVSGKNMHIAIEILPGYLNEKWRKLLFSGIDILIILFVIAVFMIGGGNYLYITYILGQTSPALNLPMWIVYCVLPIAGFFILAYKFSDLSNRLKAKLQ